MQAWSRGIERKQSVKKQHRGLVVGGGALARQAPGQGEGVMLDANTPVAKCSDIQKTYDDETLVVRNLNLDIARLGPSGSCKTTRPASPAPRCLSKAGIF